MPTDRLQSFYRPPDTYCTPKWGGGTKNRYKVQYLTDTISAFEKELATGFASFPGGISSQVVFEVRKKNDILKQEYRMSLKTWKKVCTINLHMGPSLTCYTTASGHYMYSIIKTHKCVHMWRLNVIINFCWSIMFRNNRNAKSFWSNEPRWC